MINCFLRGEIYSNSHSFETIQGGKYSHLVRGKNRIWMKTINLGIPLTSAGCPSSSPLKPQFTIHATSITIWNNGAWKLATDWQLKINELLIETRAQKVSQPVVALSGWQLDNDTELVVHNVIRRGISLLFVVQQSEELSSTTVSSHTAIPIILTLATHKLALNMKESKLCQGEVYFPKTWVSMSNNRLKAIFLMSINFWENHQSGLSWELPHLTFDKICSKMD